MYSPKIDEALIPALYHTARARRVPMTRLVAQLIRKAMRTELLVNMTHLITIRRVHLLNLLLPPLVTGHTHITKA